MEQLDISDNLISNIEGDAFQAMDRLRVLKLSRNKLTRFNSDVFNGAHNIQHLELADNFITEFPTVALKVFTGLRYLNLSANVIRVSYNISKQNHYILVSLWISRKLNITFSITVYVRSCSKRACCCHLGAKVSTIFDVSHKGILKFFLTIYNNIYDQNSPTIYV